MEELGISEDSSMINASLTTTQPEASDGIEVQDAIMESIDEGQNDNLRSNDTEEGQDTDEEGQYTNEESQYTDEEDQGTDEEDQDMDDEHFESDYESVDECYDECCDECCDSDQSDASGLENYNSEEDDEDEPDLSKIQPVRAFIPLEIWLEIFSFSEPKWLARARRVSRTFRSLINNEDVWKRARRYRHPDYPGPIFGFTEMGMWSFQWGLDCTGCGTKKGRIVKHWQFHAKFCRDCSKKVLIRGNQLMNRSGFDDKWREYLTPTYDQYYSSGYVYYLKDIESIEEKMKTLETHDHKEILKKKVADSDDLRKLLLFEQLLTMEELNRVRTIKTNRYRDILERCLLLSPPLEENVLKRITAYPLALDVTRPLTNRSWEVLREKLEAGRKLAEESIHAEEVKKERKRKAKEQTIAKLQEFTDTWEAAKTRLADYIDEFLAKNGGTVKEGFESSFALQALQYARKKWHEIEENSKKQLPLGMISYLMKTKLVDICNGQRRLFSCKLCIGGKPFSSVNGLFSHVLSPRHKRDERLNGMIKPIDGLPFDTCGVKFPCVEELTKTCVRTQWLENLPMYAPGPIFKPLFEQSFSNFNPQEQAYPKPINSPKVIPATDSSPLSLERVKAIMHRELATTKDAQISVEIQLFLWFKLSINSYIREHNTLPTIMGFVAVAGSIFEGWNTGMYRTLTCGVCNTRSDGEGRELTWDTLGEHFVKVHRKFRDKWPERLLKTPNARDVYYRMTKDPLKCETVDMWIKLLQEADAHLAEEVSSLRAQNSYI